MRTTHIRTNLNEQILNKALSYCVPFLKVGTVIPATPHVKPGPSHASRLQRFTTRVPL